MENYEARLNISYGGQNGDLPDPVSFDSTDGDVKAFAQEAVRNGSVPGINADPTASFEDFVVDRYTATEEVDYNRLMLRPKTPFGDPLRRMITVNDVKELVEDWKTGTGKYTRFPPETHFTLNLRDADEGELDNP
jgi:hypothetical protein